MTQILNIAGYKFVPLTKLDLMRQTFLDECSKLDLKGTILLSHEGINVSLSGRLSNVDRFKQQLRRDSHFEDMTFRESFSDTQVFKRLKVKLKKEIITFRQPEVHAEIERAPDISPEEFKKWLDENRDITILDTRNDYEVRFGTFKNALNLHLQNFCELPDAVKDVDKNKPLVMFCTGGVRCEKAGLYMRDHGFTDVYQLDGGILNYFAKVGGAHYEGECFIFDDRISVDAQLKETGTVQCKKCHGPVTLEQQKLPSYQVELCCPACA